MIYPNPPPIYTVYLDLLGHRFIGVEDHIYRLYAYGDLKEEKPIDVMKETRSKVVVNLGKKSWTDYNFSLKRRIDMATLVELDLAAYELETMAGESGFRRYSQDEDIRSWLQSTATYRTL